MGLVCEVKDGKVFTIEGNTLGGGTLVPNGGGVAMKSYALTYSKILGYASPRYEEETMFTYEQFKEYAARYEQEQRDQPVSSWAAEDWKTATELRLFDGTMPQAPLTREQAAVVLGRVMGEK